MHSASGSLAGKLLGAAVLCLVISSAPSLASVPSSLEQRMQEASVEELLRALEAKAAAAGDGIWAIGSGAQNVAGTNSQCGTNGAQWYFKPAAGDTIFSDGQTFYEASNLKRYYLDSIEQGRPDGYNLGPYLLELNLHPRQFLGPRPLKNLGQVIVDKVSYIDLQADLLDDPATRSDHYATKAKRTATIDYFYDPAHAAIGKVAVALHHGPRFITTVTAWDKFATNGDWPAKMVGQKFNSISKPLGQPILTTVDSFTSANDPAVAEAAKAVSAAPFYGGVLEDLRQPQIYTSESPDLTESIFATQAAFAAGQVKTGSDEWQALDKQLTDPVLRSRLESIMVQPAGFSLTTMAARTTSERQPRIDLIKQLISGDLSSAQWRERATLLCQGWVRLHYEAELPDIEALDDMMLHNIGKYGDGQALRVLVSFLQKDKAMAAKGDPILKEVVAAPLPAAGYAGTQQCLLIGICLSEGQTDRVQMLLDALQWDTATPDSAKASVESIQSLIGLENNLSDAAIGATLLDVYNQSLETSTDSITSNVCRARSMQLAAKAVLSSGWAKEKDPKADVPAAADYLLASASKPNADKFWDHVISAMLTIRIEDTQSADVVTKAATDLAAAYGQQFKKPGYLSFTWRRFGYSRLFSKRVFSPMARLDYLNKAFITAESDVQRIKAMNRIVKLMESIGNHDQATQIVQQLKSSLQSASAQGQADVMIQSIAQDKANYQARVETRDHQVAVVQLQGQLTSLQSQLEEGQKEGISQQDLDSIQAVIDKTQIALKAATQPSTTQTSSE